MAVQNISHISKHLMLLFISCGRLSGYDGNLFQNISCYCLSTENSYSPFVSTDFKTSHVIVYRKYPVLCIPEFLISKHLMLLFIINFPLALCPHCIFQNILCYCLSKTTALWYITNMNFKTSYVIVYQQRFLGVQKLILDFKTSYVIVYRLCKCMGVTKQNNFKTSYVIVYPPFSLPL